MNKQSGQTLIETIVAIAVLTTALTAGLALTIYVLSHSDRSAEQVVAVNIAREAVDVVRNMRDTNWLESDAVGGGYDLTSCTIGSNQFNCFPQAWDGVPAAGYHNYILTDNANYRLELTGAGSTWKLVANPNYRLTLGADGLISHLASNPPFNYSRKVTISHDPTPPFGGGSLSELVVAVTVGWKGRGCSSMDVNWDPSTTNCNVVVTERLTNWKDYK